MNEEESLQMAIQERIRIMPYNPMWPEKYEEEKRRLVSILSGTFLVLEHVGSTSIPGMACKPVIDIIGGVRSMQEADDLLPALCQSGYCTSAEFNATLDDQRWLMRHSRGHRTHHLHLLIHDAREWRRKIAFRDVLRANPDIALRYLDLKSKIAEVMGSDREAYTFEKTEFVEEILRDHAES